jgi:hypothetical protein
MKSKTRNDCETAEALFAGMLMSLQDRIENKRMLVCGTAGNPLTHNGKPGLDNPQWYPGYNITTLDFDKDWNPDIVGDILTPEQWGTHLYKAFDLIHMTQVLEHIEEPWLIQNGFEYLIKKDGYIIVDSPWGPNSPDYHGVENSFGDYWRISKDGMKALFGKKFKIVKTIATDANTSCLLRSYQ